MITNRPKYLMENIPFYNSFPEGYDLIVDYSLFPRMLNFDFQTLNGILPLTKSRFNHIGINSESNGEKGTVVFVNPHPEEYDYYESIGVTEFQAISIIFNFYALELCGDNVLKGRPYSVSLIPMEKNKKIDTWSIDLLKQFDLRELSQQGGNVFTNFDPFNGWYDGYATDYSVFSQITENDYIDSIGFQWGLYFLSPIYDKKEIIIHENSTYSRPVNAKFRKYKTKLYYTPFKTTQPRRIWGCDSPIELFLLQGLHIRNLNPEIQTGIYRTGEIVSNYYKMQEQEQWLGEDKLLTSADFYFPKEKLAIFCDGSEFHDMKKDKEISKELNDLGIHSLRFSGKEITETIEKVLDRIELKIAKMSAANSGE